MCGRVTQRSGVLPGLTTVMGDGGDSRIKDPKDLVRYNDAPSQDFWVIRRHPKSGEYLRDRLTWGLIPHWVKDATGGHKPINAKAETVDSLPSFRDAYRRRRYLLPIDNFFEWKAIKGAKTKQPHAIPIKSGEPFALAAIIPPEAYDGWLSPIEPAPRDPLLPYEPMTMWPISTRVNKPDNDDAAIMEPVELGGGPSLL